MTTDGGTDEVVSDPAAHHAARLRGPRRTVLGGLVLAVLTALGAGAVGADGRSGFLLMLLVLAVAFAVTGLWLAVHLLVDQFRGDPTSLGRSLFALGMFLAAMACLVSFSGVVASAGAAS